MPISYRDYLPFAEKHEGRVEWMYLDTRRNVTVGIGHLLATAADAEAVAFTDGATGRPAGREARRSAFGAVRDATHLAAVGAGAFERITSLRLPRAAAGTLFERDFDRVQRRVRLLFGAVGGGLDSYPDAAQLAVIDMAFNLGPDGLYGKFPKFRNEGLARRDFEIAAEESHRTWIPAARNAETRSLLLEAARIERRHR